MRLLTILVFSLCSFLCLPSFGEDKPVVSHPRIDLISKDTKLEPADVPAGGYLLHPNWKKGDDQLRALTSECRNVPEGKWSTFVLSFIPEQDGTVELTLCGSFSKSNGKKELNQEWVYFDSIKSDGATILNDDFAESIEKSGKTKPKDWILAGEYTTNGEGLLNGKTAIKVWHNKPAKQMLNVKAKEKVTLTFVVMPAEAVMATE